MARRWQAAWLRWVQPRGVPAPAPGPGRCVPTRAPLILRVDLRPAMPMRDLRVVPTPRPRPGPTGYPRSRTPGRTPRDPTAPTVRGVHGGRTNRNGYLSEPRRSLHVAHVGPHVRGGIRRGRPDLPPHGSRVRASAPMPRCPLQPFGTRRPWPHHEVMAPRRLWSSTRRWNRISFAGLIRNRSSVGMGRATVAVAGGGRGRRGAGLGVAGRVGR